jgi:hypothetical protein
LGKSVGIPGASRLFGDRPLPGRMVATLMRQVGKR